MFYHYRQYLTMSRIWFLVCLSLLTRFECASQTRPPSDDDNSLKPATDSKFHVGDVWEYHTRRGEERSRFIIVKIERAPKVGIIVHIGVDRLNWMKCSTNATPESIRHMPFTREAIGRSAVRRVATNRPLPDYRHG